MSEQACIDSSENKDRNPFTAVLAWSVFLAMQFSILINTHGQTPPFQWAKQAGGSGSDEGYAITVDAAGNSYVAGRFSSTNVSFGDVSPTNGGSFIAKYDNLGNLLWAKSAGSGNIRIDSIAVDQSGDSHVIGYFRETATFGSTVLTSFPDEFGFRRSDIFVAKYDSVGNVIWARQAGGTDYDYGYGITVDAAGASYVTGVFRSTNATFGGITLTNSSSGGSVETNIVDSFSDYDIFVAKYDGVGNVVWAKQAGGTDDDKAFGIGVDGAGNCLVTGYFTGTATFGGTNLSANSPFDEDIFVAKYDPAGNVLWARAAGGANADEARGLAVDPAGNSYVTGFFDSPTATFGDTILINPNFHTNVVNTNLDISAGLEIFVAKYDSAGNVLWAREAGGSDIDGGLGIAVDAAGNSYVTGVFLSPTVTFGSTTLTNNSSTNNFDIFVAKYDSVGNVLWAKQAGGSDNDGSTGIGVDAMGNSYVTGAFNSTNATFDSITLTNGGAYDLFVARIDGPRVNIAFAGNLVVVSWPTNATGLHLQVATNVVPPVVWVDSTNTPTASDEQFNVTVEATDGMRFYRLKGP